MPANLSAFVVMLFCQRAAQVRVVAENDTVSDPAIADARLWLCCEKV